jgi:hypothetical protein
MGDFMVFWVCFMMRREVIDNGEREGASGYEKRQKRGEIKGKMK